MPAKAKRRSPNHAKTIARIRKMLEGIEDEDLTTSERNILDLVGGRRSTASPEQHHRNSEACLNSDKD